MFKLNPSYWIQPAGLAAAVRKLVLEVAGAIRKYGNLQAVVKSSFDG